jgi:hypothetical protein
VPRFTTRIVFVSVSVVATSRAPNETPTEPEPSSMSAIELLVSAAGTSTRPAPTRATPYFGPVWLNWLKMSWLAVFIASAFSSSTVHVGRVCFRSAIMPATCGEAMDVPLMLRPRFPVREATDQIVWPGAARSGFRPLLRVVGPRDEKPESASMRALSFDSPTTSAESLTLTPGFTTPAVSTLFSRFPTLTFVYMPGMRGSPPIAVSRNVVESAMMMPIAPAVKALPPRTPEPHGNALLPIFQSTSTIRPAMFAASAPVQAEQPNWFVAG